MKRIVMMVTAVVLICLSGCNAKGSHRHTEADDVECGGCGGGSAACRAMGERPKIEERGERRVEIL